MKTSQIMILDGQKEAVKIIKALKHESAKTKSKITLAVILVGNNPASKLYVSLKEKKAKEIGFEFKKFFLPASASEKKIITLIQKLNSDKKITGTILQLPLPKKINANKIIKFISPKKDVDGLLADSKTIPPTIQSILHLIKLSRQKLAGKNAVIICNSPEFAEPLKFLLAKNFKLKKIDIIKNPIASYKLQVTSYDVIISVIGQKHFLKPQTIKKDAVVIDVGITRQNKKTFGDVHPDCFQKSKYISPVPGGVGPLTVAYLMKNLLKLKD